MVKCHRIQWIRWNKMERGCVEKSLFDNGKNADRQLYDICIQVAIHYTHTPHLTQHDVMLSADWLADESAGPWLDDRSGQKDLGMRESSVRGWWVKYICIMRAGVHMQFTASGHRKHLNWDRGTATLHLAQLIINASYNQLQLSFHFSPTPRMWL
jgi:hypothetical protein